MTISAADGFRADTTCAAPAPEPKHNMPVRLPSRLRNQSRRRADIGSGWTFVLTVLVCIALALLHCASASAEDISATRADGQTGVTAHIHVDPQMMARIERILQAAGRPTPVRCSKPDETAREPAPKASRRPTTTIVAVPTCKRRQRGSAANRQLRHSSAELHRARNLHRAKADAPPPDGPGK